MLVRLLLIMILIVISLFCWLSPLNPMDVEFRFFGETIPTDLSTLMISSFVLGAMFVFISTLARDAKLCLRLEMLDEALEVINEISLRLMDFPALHRLLAEIYLHKKDFGRAAQEFEKTFELSGTSYLPFSCSVCERDSIEWIAYCPQCHQWSTYAIKEGEKTIRLPSPSFSERAHFPLSIPE